MTARPSFYEKQAREFLRPYYGFWARQPDRPREFIVNREGFPNTRSRVIQWMLKKGWIKRERRRSPSGVCRNRQITFMVLTSKAKE